MCEIQYSRYSDLDDKVILKASSLGMPLIGGTALEFLAYHTNHISGRVRSDNDLDFITNSEWLKDEFQLWLKMNIDPVLVQVDVMLVKSHVIPKELVIDIKGILVMGPEYIIWSKLQRFSLQDIKDIKWLLSIVTAENLEVWLQHMGITAIEVERINSIIKQVYG